MQPHCAEEGEYVVNPYLVPPPPILEMLLIFQALFLDREEE
jgi:hypothetical protein